MPDLENKTILITGATDGIGKVAAFALARMGARLVILSRNPQKTTQIAQQIRSETGNNQVETLSADLSVQSEVRRAAEEFKQRFNRLDVLINNAGAVFMTRQVSADGIEMTLALNHLGYFTLTNSLLDLLISSAPSRIINVSSDAHQGATLDFNDLQNQNGYVSFRAYGRSKLANLYFTYELARRLEGTRVTVNALHPGFVATNFGVSNGGIYRWIFKLGHLGAIAPDQGAETIIYLASSAEVEGVSGKYFVKKKAVSSSQVSYDAQAARRLWDASLELTGQAQPQ